MVYMDFEALMKNSPPFWVYCVSTNCGDRNAPTSLAFLDRLQQDVVMENTKIRLGEKAITPVMVTARSAVKVVYVGA